MGIKKLCWVSSGTWTSIPWIKFPLRFHKRVFYSHFRTEYIWYIVQYQCGHMDNAFSLSNYGVIFILFRPTWMKRLATYFLCLLPHACHTNHSPKKSTPTIRHVFPLLIVRSKRIISALSYSVNCSAIKLCLTNISMSILFIRSYTE